MKSEHFRNSASHNTILGGFRMAVQLQQGLLGRGVKHLLFRLLKLLKCDYPIPKNICLSDLVCVFICHMYFARGRRERLPSYNYDKLNPYHRGYLIREEEKRLEYPVPLAALSFQGPQELLLTAVRTSGETLVVRFARAERRQAQINILLRDSRARTFTTVESESQHFLLDISHENKFQAGGLRMQCSEPMRRWRIAFSGLLINKETGETAYVKFYFLWISLSHVFDWACDIPAKRLMKFCLDSRKVERKSDIIANIELCRDYLNGFEESGHCVGSVKVSFKNNKQISPEEVVQELHMRGNFLRIRHPNLSTASRLKLNGFVHNIIYSKKGHLLQVSAFKFNKGKSIVFGSFLSVAGFKDPVESFLNNKGLEADFDDVLYSPTLKFSTSELTHEVLRSEAPVLSSYKSNLTGYGEVQISKLDALIDNIPAVGILIQGLRVGFCDDDLLQPPLNILDHDTIAIPAPYVISLENPQCKNSTLTGSKGACLAVLTELSAILEGNNRFYVPRGVVLTTEAFRRFMQSPAIQSMKNDLNKVLEVSSVEEVRKISETCMNAVRQEQMPSALSKDVLQNLHEMFPDWSSRRFAIRSSFVGEASEDMSAADEMQTLLGIKGDQQILESVLKCWASQFSHVAIEHKKRYAQESVGDIAVVIMEMVPADCAGVMFTCDPLTGDPSTVYITSNFGLGESVVSAMTDPDIIRLNRDKYRKLSLKDISVGKKSVKIVMNQEGEGILVESVTNNNLSSLSLLQAEFLGEVGVKIERCYGDCRVIEWAYAGDILYIMQARPINFMDRPLDSEISIDFNIPSRTEASAYWSAGVGGVSNGALSPLTINLMSRSIGIEMQRRFGKTSRKNRSACTPYYDAFLKVARNHYFIDTLEVLRALIPDSTNKAQVESLMLNICGRVVEDDELYADIGNKTDKIPGLLFWREKKEILKMKYLGRPILRFNQYLARKKTRYPMASMTLEELFDGFTKACYVVTDYATYPHLSASSGASQWTYHIVEYLREVTNESMETICGVVSLLLSSADDAISREVPKKLKNLATLISTDIGEEKFLECSTSAAETLLLDDNNYPDIAAEFRKYLKQIELRGHDEIDIYRKTWNMDASPVITSLQSLIRDGMETTSKNYEGLWKSIQNIKCRLTLWQKLRLALLVHFLCKAVGTRENTKALWIWTQSICRKWAWALARRMKEEGRLPDEKLLFFCSFNELHKLIRARDSSLIARAYHRLRLFPEPVSQQSEHFHSIPRSFGQLLPTFEDGIVQMKGFPIREGRIQANARIINNINEAQQIQAGEILIIYATDVGLFPYFPILGGVVTELGGLMSHGAVVAREYGLPCIVGLFGATKVFRSGDTVLLDGSEGLLTRIGGTM